jgi:hypothetical protein
MNEPSQGEIYRHYRDGLCEVVMTAAREDDLAAVIVYKRLSDNKILVCPHFAWSNPMLGHYYNKRQALRFEKVS